MAGSFGYKFIFFSAVFYLFLGMILASGASAWLTASITTNDTLSNVDYSTNVTNSADIYTTTKYILQNPFSDIAWLAWLSVAILITDIYIIVTSLIP